jgi:hypothetical protein
MPRRFDVAVEAVRRSIAERDDGGDREAVREVAALRETYLAWCERLAAAPGAGSLDHNDLHRGTCSSQARPAQGGQVLRLRRRRPRPSVRLHARPLSWTQRRLALSLDASELLRTAGEPGERRAPQRRDEPFGRTRKPQAALGDPLQAPHTAVTSRLRQERRRGTTTPPSRSLRQRLHTAYP